MLGWWRARSRRVQERVVGATLVGVTSPVLGLAAWLDADPSGVGTHKQLGLGGCTVLTMTGWPCPMCGMTTTFTHMGHGHIFEAAVTQPFGVVLYLITLAAFLLGVGALAGRSWWRTVGETILEYEVQIAAGILVGMTAGWLYKCISMGVLHSVPVG